MKTIPPPGLEMLRRVFPRAAVPKMPDPIRRTAFHEAAHCVVAEFYGIRPTLATIEVCEAGASGEMEFCRDFPENTDASDPDGLAALAAGSIHHAGLAAELLLCGIDQGNSLMLRESSADLENARAVLQDKFPHSSGAHWYAQRQAMHILTEHWPRVQEIAAQLIEHGAWTPAIDGDTN